MKTSVVAILDGEDADRLMELTAPVKALPSYEGSAELYQTAVRAHANLMAFQAKMVDKYVSPSRNIEELEELYGDYGYDFDAVAGTITKDES
jgi:hypothetical protein